MSGAHNISTDSISHTMTQYDEHAHVRPLIYFTGAATDTTMLLSGRPSINAFLRSSYSSKGIPGVSSPALTGYARNIQYRSYVRWNGFDLRRCECDIKWGCPYSVGLDGGFAASDEASCE
jgi:hypothetical protein